MPNSPVPPDALHLSQKLLAAESKLSNAESLLFAAQTPQEFSKATILLSSAQGFLKGVREEVAQKGKEKLMVMDMVKNGMEFESVMKLCYHEYSPRYAHPQIQSTAFPEPNASPSYAQIAAGLSTSTSANQNYPQNTATIQPVPSPPKQHSQSLTSLTSLTSQTLPKPLLKTPSAPSSSLTSQTSQTLPKPLLKAPSAPSSSQTFTKPLLDTPSAPSRSQTAKTPASSSSAKSASATTFKAPLPVTKNTPNPHTTQIGSSKSLNSNTPHKPAVKEVSLSLQRGSKNSVASPNPFLAPKPVPVESNTHQSAVKGSSPANNGFKESGSNLFKATQSPASSIISNGTPDILPIANRKFFADILPKVRVLPVKTTADSSAFIPFDVPSPVKVIVKKSMLPSNINSTVPSNTYSLSSGMRQASESSPKIDKPDGVIGVIGVIVSATSSSFAQDGAKTPSATPSSKYDQYQSLGAKTVQPAGAKIATKTKAFVKADSNMNTPAPRQKSYAGPSPELNAKSLGFTVIGTGGSNGFQGKFYRSFAEQNGTAVEASPQHSKSVAAISTSDVSQSNAVQQSPSQSGGFMQGGSSTPTQVINTGGMLGGPNISKSIYQDSSRISQTPTSSIKTKPTLRQIKLLSDLEASRERKKDVMDEARVVAGTLHEYIVENRGAETARELARNKEEEREDQDDGEIADYLKAYVNSTKNTPTSSKRAKRARTFDPTRVKQTYGDGSSPKKLKFSTVKDPKSNFAREAEAAAVHEVAPHPTMQSVVVLSTSQSSLPARQLPVPVTTVSPKIDALDISPDIDAPGSTGSSHSDVDMEIDSDEGSIVQDDTQVLSPFDKPLASPRVAAGNSSNINQRFNDAPVASISPVSQAGRIAPVSTPISQSLQGFSLSSVAKSFSKPSVVSAKVISSTSVPIHSAKKVNDPAISLMQIGLDITPRPQPPITPSKAVSESLGSKRSADTSQDLEKSKNVKLSELLAIRKQVLLSEFAANKKSGAAIPSAPVIVTENVVEGNGDLIRNLSDYVAARKQAAAAEGNSAIDTNTVIVTEEISENDYSRGQVSSTSSSNAEFRAGKLANLREALAKETRISKIREQQRVEKELSVDDSLRPVDNVVQVQRKPVTNANQLRAEENVEEEPSSYFMDIGEDFMSFD